MRLSSSHKLFGQERETVDEAWPGDVIGLVGHDAFGIGDTLSEDRAHRLQRDSPLPAGGLHLHLEPEPRRREEIPGGPRAAPPGGRRAVVHGAVAPPGATLLAAVGPLQFEVVQYRLKSEYGAESRLEPTPWTLLRWIEPHPALADPRSIVVATGVSFGADKNGQPVALFPNDWTLRYFVEKNPDLKLRELPPEPTPSE